MKRIIVKGDSTLTDEEVRAMLLKQGIGAFRRLSGYVPKQAPIEDCRTEFFTLAEGEHTSIRDIYVDKDVPMCWECREAIGRMVSRLNREYFRYTLGTANNSKPCYFCGKLSDVPF